MEIEAKFAIADRATFERLLQVERLAGFALSPVQLQQLHDRYLDTADGSLLRGGFACRVRADANGELLLTLKALTPASSYLHARQEVQTRLPRQAGLDIDAWPASDATALARQLSRGQPLQVLFDLRQERRQRLAATVAGGPPQVELSIDVTRFNAHVSVEQMGVEAELLPAGDPHDLQAIVAELHQAWRLRPDPVSKFERGLALARPELVPVITAR